jgi:DNA invertase Pin-like site-specific DNA recombinase
MYQQVRLEPPIGAYLRASDDQQEDSHERQEGLIRSFLLANSLTIAADNWHTDFRARDEAYSANADSFQALLHKIRRKQIRTVLVSNLDRWGSEDIDQFFKFRGILLENGCKLWSVEDGDLTSKDMGDIIKIVVKAEQMREYVRRMAKNIASGKERNAKAGHWNGGKCSPYGFDRVMCDETGKALWLCHYETMSKRIIFRAKRTGGFDFDNPEVWEGLRNRPPKNDRDFNVLVPSRRVYGSYQCIDGDRVKNVKNIFNFIITKPWSINKMARVLSDMGVTYYGHRLTVQRIFALVRNEAYKGDLTWNKTQRAKYAICTNGQVKEVTPVRHKRNRNHPGAMGTLVTLHKAKTDWTYREGTHEGIVSSEVWQDAQEWLDKKRRRKQPRSSDHYLRGLLWCGECQASMYGHMQQGTGKKKTKVRYPGYYCTGPGHHWIKHSDVERWLFEKLAQVGVEVGRASEVQDLKALYEKYNQDNKRVTEFFRKGVTDYLAEIEAFYTKHGLDARKVRAYIALAIADLGRWKMATSEMTTEIRGRLQEIDSRKVGDAKRLLAKKKDEHRQAVKAFMFAKDEMTQRVMQEEIDRLVREAKELEEETKPWLERYQEITRQLVQFKLRLHQLLKTFDEADVDAKAQRLAEILDRITLYFVPKPKGQGRTVDTAQSGLTFNKSFMPNEPSS